MDKVPFLVKKSGGAGFREAARLLRSDASKAYIRNAPISEVDSEGVARMVHSLERKSATCLDMRRWAPVVNTQVLRACGSSVAANKSIPPVYRTWVAPALPQQAAPHPASHDMFATDALRLTLSRIQRACGLCPAKPEPYTFTLAHPDYSRSFLIPGQFTLSRQPIVTETDQICVPGVQVSIYVTAPSISDAQPTDLSSALGLLSVHPSISLSDVISLSSALVQLPALSMQYTEARSAAKALAMVLQNGGLSCRVKGTTIRVRGLDPAALHACGIWCNDASSARGDAVELHLQSLVSRGLKSSDLKKLASILLNVNSRSRVEVATLSLQLSS
ncbi:hypothetical protein DIPPA_30132 [Diplonema papillatum]|nr:hypothetical protein DIPPA_30132 [Diplonema papillatum]